MPLKTKELDGKSFDLTITESVISKCLKRLSLSPSESIRKIHGFLRLPISNFVSIYVFETTFLNPSPPPFSKGRRSISPFCKACLPVGRGDEGGLDCIFQRAKVLSDFLFRIQMRPSSAKLR